MKFNLTIILLILSMPLFAQVDYEALMDSLNSETYIGMEIELQEVEVESDRVEQKGKALNFYKTNKLNTTDDVLSRLQGISMIKRGNYAWEPTLHGLSAGQINVSIDGMKIFGACTDKMDPVTSYIEPNNMGNVMVTDGMKGGEHGCTVGGAIAFETVKPKFGEAMSGNISTRFESVSNAISQLASLNLSKNKWAVRLNGAFRKYNNYKNGHGETVLYSGFQKSNYAISAGYALTPNSLLSVDFIGDDAKNVGYPALPMDVAFARAKIIGVSYDIWSPRPWINHVEAKVYYNYINHAMDDTQRENVAIHMDMPGNTKTNGAYVNSHLKFGRHHAQAKLDYFMSKAYAEMTMYSPDELPMFMLTWPDVKRNDIAIFLKDNFRLNHTAFELRTRLELASTSMLSNFGKQQFSVFGFDETDMSDRTMVYNVGTSIIQHWNKKLSTIVSIDNGSRLPTVSEQYGFYLYNSFDGYDYLGNPNINNEISTQIALETKYVNKLVDLRVNLFKYWFKDYIFGKVDHSLDRMTIGANGVKVYKNIENADYKGFDVQLFINVSSALQLYFSSKYTYAKDNEQNPLPLIPPLKNSAAFIYQIKGFKIQAEIERSSTQERINLEAGEKETNSYLVSNLRLEKKLNFNSSDLSLSLGSENVFNTYYRDHLDWGNIMRPGRNFYISATYSFN